VQTVFFHLQKLRGKNRQLLLTLIMGLRLITILLVALINQAAAQEKNAEGNYFTVIPDSLPVLRLPEGKSLSGFLSDNLDTENACMRHSCVKIKIECCVGADGELKSYRLTDVNDTHYLSQIPGLMEKMKYWKPAIKNGETIDCRFIFPIYIYRK
jgi:hypothetical protein